MLFACMAGVLRRMDSIAANLTNRKYAEGKSDLQIDVEGAIAEDCFAKNQDLYWGWGVNTFKLSDVSTWQVRSTSYADGHLIVRPRDEKIPNHVRVALVVVDICTANAFFGGELVGWTTFGEARAKQWWREDKNAWWVPEKALRKFQEEASPCPAGS
jgi:hypothetical protein